MIQLLCHDGAGQVNIPDPHIEMALSSPGSWEVSPPKATQKPPRTIRYLRPVVVEILGRSSRKGSLQGRKKRSHLLLSRRLLPLPATLPVMAYIGVYDVSSTEDYPVIRLADKDLT